MEQNEEKIVGTNLTVVPEFSQTALGLAELKKEFAGVVYNVENNPAELKLAKQAKKKLTTLRTTLDKTKKDVKADLLERTRKIDGEYNRILGEIRSLEDPIGDQIDREENRIALEQAEALRVEQERIDGHKATIQAWRDLPSAYIGMPAARITKAITDVTHEGDFSYLEEFAEEGEDAYEACISKMARLRDDALRQEQEVEAQRQRDEEAAALRARNAKLEREAEERRLADEKRIADEQAEAYRKELARVLVIKSAIQDIRSYTANTQHMDSAELKGRLERLQHRHPAKGEFDFQESHGEAVQAWNEADAHIRDAIVSAEASELAAEEERDRRAAELANLQKEREEAHARAVEAERIQREQATKAEEERQASLTLRTSAMALLHRVQTECMGHWQEAIDLGQVLATSEGDVKPTKRQPRKPVKVPR